MFVGGSAGSTTGSIKVVRHLLVGKILRRELDQTVSPEVVMPVRLNRAPVDERTLRAIATFILLYVGFWVGRRRRHRGRLRDQRRSARHARHAGRLGERARQRRPRASESPGRSRSFAPLGDVTKITMILLMWLGRLEIIPVVVLVTRHYWRV